VTVRIYELSKELGVKSKDLVELAKSLGFDVKTHMSSLTAGEIVKVKQALASKGKPAAPAKPKAPGKAAKPAAGKPAVEAKVPEKPEKPAVPEKPAPSPPPPPPPPPPKPLSIAERPLTPRKLLPKKPGAKVVGFVNIQPVVSLPKAKPAAPAARPGVPMTIGTAPPSAAAPAAARPPQRRESSSGGPKTVYRPGDQEVAPLTKLSKKSRPTPQPLARIPLAPEEEDTRKIKFRGKHLRRSKPDELVKDVDEAAPEVPVRPPRVPFRRRPKLGAPTKPTIAPPPVKPTHVELVTPITIKEMSYALGIRASVIIGKLMQMGIMANINQTLENDVVNLLAAELGVQVEMKKPKELSEEILLGRKIEEKPEDLVLRAPVVTFMGHVDHGKTSLLDAIRHANVVATESGGITQHIGAYKVTTAQGRSVVFLDTPGHEAFTEMRARGANVTSVVVLVVAADDGVMPQTEEAVNHAKAANVPIVVALNKMDLPRANPNRVKQQLSGLGLIWDQWGGNTVIVECSAVTRAGLDELVEMLGLEAELLELKANPKRPAEGTVLEARTSEGWGVTATVLVQNGTLRVGDTVLCGRAYGRVRAMFDDKGVELKEAGPATPISLIGLSQVPEAGDRLYAVDDIAMAKTVADERDRKMRQESLSRRTGIKLEEFFEYMKTQQIKELRVILKTDVKGSLEVLRKSIEELSTSEVRVRVLHGAVGGINESDVLLANASDAVIIGFHVAPEDKARHLAEDKDVDIRLYQVIYQVTDEVHKALEGMLSPEKREIIDGHIDVRETFKVSRLGTIAGCYVLDGTVSRNNKIRVVRDGKVIYDGGIESLKRFKEDVREVRAGFECGIKIANFDDIKVGDRFETYHIEEFARKL
jgi:translation initiation factor IF-2